LSINRDEIQELVYLGLAQGVETVLFSQSMWDSPTATRIINESYSYKPDVANRLLDELGLTERSGDGFRLRPDGKELSLLIEVPQSWPELIDAATLVQEYLDDVGIKATAKTQDDSLVVKRTQSDDVQVVGYLLTYIGWISDPRDYVPVAGWGCYWGNQYAQWYNSGGERGMEPPSEIMKIIDLYGEISMTLDMNERARLEEELFQHYAEQVIGIPVVGLIPNLAVAKDSFQNLPEIAFNSWPLRYPGYLNPEQFYIRQ
jgi:peptide/nickel transport system substrate-binding protein